MSVIYNPYNNDDKYRSSKKIYYPYPANDGKHKDIDRKQLYINRHKNKENWSKTGIDTAGWWSRYYLWEYPTKQEALKEIRNKLKSWKII